MILDSDTAPGWLMAVLNFIFLILVVLAFTDLRRQESAEATLPVASVESQASDVRSERLPALGLLACSWSACVSGTIIATCEVFTVHLGKDYWGWSVDAAAWYLAGVMLVSGVLSLFAGRLLTVYPVGSDRAGLLGAAALGAACCVVSLDYGLQSVTAAASLFSFALLLILGMSSVIRSFALSLVTKLVPVHQKAIMSMWALASNAAGRGVGAIIGSAVTPESFALVMMGLFLSAAAACAASFRQMEVHAKAA